MNDEQRMLAEMVGPFLADRAPVAHMRALRDSDDPTGFDRALWRSFGEMGLAGLLVPEASGGSGLGLTEAIIVLEEIGANLTPSPFLMTGVGAALALRDAPEAVRQRWLPAIAAGEAVAALAIEEGPRHRPEGIALSAARQADGWRLNGAKTFVIQGGQADLTLVVAREADGFALFAVEPSASGLEIDSERLVDSSLAARMRFADVAADRIGGQDVIHTLLAGMRIAAAAELVGLATRAFTITMAYLRDRTQFDKPIGSFQALQHRAAHLHGELEMARATLLKAAATFDAGSEDAGSMAMLAKAVAGSSSALAVQEAVQMHGGIGMTDEYDIGFYMKRQRVLAEFMGDTDYHADGLARLAGY